MTVYQRTADGQWAAYSDQSPLPRKLKLLLKAVNGAVDEDVYALTLTAFGDVAQLLRSLERAGLVEDASNPGRKEGADQKAILDKLERLAAMPMPAAPPAPASAPASATTSGASQWDRTIVLRGPALSREEIARLVDVPVAMQAPATAPAPVPAPPAAMPAPAPLPAPAPTSTVLQQAVQQMADFVLTHVPASAMQVLPEIEALKSLDELSTLMGGYSQFVAPTGAVGEQHLAHLERLLAAAPMELHT
jgi:hypothetical protein